MFVVMRFRLGEAGSARADLHAVAAALARRDGCERLELGQNLDDPALWSITSHWRDIRAYRWALGGIEMRMLLMAVAPFALDEPTAYAAPSEVGVNVPRVSEGGDPAH